MDPVKLVVKAPNQQIEDQIMEVDLRWTVRDLKKHISNYYPSKPVSATTRVFALTNRITSKSIKDQRLIYSGHLLTDEQTLRAAFEPLTGENIHVHLVCAQRQSEPKKLENSAKIGSTQAPIATNSNVANSNQSSNHVVTGSTAPVGNQQMPFVNHPLMMPGMFPMFTGVPGAVTPIMWTPEQMAQMQQMYSQFLAQYNLQPNAAIAPVPMSFPQMFNNNVQANEPLQGQQAAPILGAGEQAPGPLRLDDAEEDEDENRDWLDLFYWLSRAVVLFSVVYFYSSFTRLIVVVGIAILMYLHQIGFIFPRNNNRQAAFGRQEAVVRPRQEDRAIGGNNDETEPLTDRPVTERTPSDPERCSGLRLFWVIVSSLFTSLIPETQAPVNFN